MVTKAKPKVTVDQWSIKNISAGLRKVVNKAAKSEGITIGEYVERALHQLHNPSNSTVHVSKVENMNDVKNALHVLEKRIVHLEKLPGHSKVARTKVKKLAEKVPLKKWFTKSNSVLHDVYNYTKKRISHGK